MTKPTRVLQAAFLVIAAAGAASAQDAPVERPVAVSGSVNADLLSHYVWRGVRLSDGFVVQPSIGVESHGFSVNAWWNFAGSSPDTPPSGG